MWYSNERPTSCLDRQWRNEPLQSTSVGSPHFSLLCSASIHPSIHLQGRSKERSWLAAHFSLRWSSLLETHQLLSVLHTHTHTQTATLSFTVMLVLIVSSSLFWLPAFPSHICLSLMTSPTVKHKREVKHLTGLTETVLKLADSTIHGPSQVTDERPLSLSGTTGWRPQCRTCKRGGWFVCYGSTSPHTQIKLLQVVLFIAKYLIQKRHSAWHT